MTYTPDQIRAVQLRSKARKFAVMVRDSNLAYYIPDEIIDWLTDAELQVFMNHLRSFGLTLRGDSRWELPPPTSTNHYP